MKTLMTGIAALLLVGCATPQEIVQQPHDGEFALKSTPEMAAVCVTRNIETGAANIISDRRPAPYGWELIARVTGEVTTIYAIAQFRPQGTGSQARLWTAQHGTASKTEVAKRLVRGC